MFNDIWIARKSALSLARNLMAVTMVIAVGTQYAVITAEDLDRLYRRDMKSYLLLVLNIARELSRRLRVADGMIASFLVAMWDANLAPGPRRNP